MLRRIDMTRGKAFATIMLVAGAVGGYLLAVASPRQTVRHMAVPQAHRRRRASSLLTSTPNALRDPSVEASAHCCSQARSSERSIFAAPSATNGRALRGREEVMLPQQASLRACRERNTGRMPLP